MKATIQFSWAWYTLKGVQYSVYYHEIVTSKSAINQQQSGTILQQDSWKAIAFGDSRLIPPVHTNPEMDEKQFDDTDPVVNQFLWNMVSILRLEQ
ncbi:hypothetical protein GX50_03212 [[Emmonsia] crescens]|uniref:Uncharacterized protein n=1 Tax=[Emmonsia] crescens TaxID=73230 RepID=A0A2B7ZK15_9EURO|nr:hypothetical protein GX50_03212 [Emmonsia crescens]